MRFVFVGVEGFGSEIFDSPAVLCRLASQRIEGIQGLFYRQLQYRDQFAKVCCTGQLDRILVYFIKPLSGDTIELLVKPQRCSQCRYGSKTGGNHQGY
jgi:hypothetical protein